MAFTQSELSTFATTIPVVDRPTAWTSIADSAYNGHVYSTFPRIALPKLPVLSTSRVPVDVRYLRRVRVVVEQYFGRMKRSWELMSRPFPLGAKYHQQDVDNIIVLTNILLRDSRIPLNDDDQQFYLKELQLIKKREDDRKLKALNAAKRCRERSSRQSQAITEALARFEPDGMVIQNGSSHRGTQMQEDPKEFQRSNLKMNFKIFLRRLPQHHRPVSLFSVQRCMSKILHL